ncbi:MAG: HTH domain-containing protein, partial [Chloroflexi bacterium]|nr:HTH domain-containing protein [Chloroflexota bacterium]
MATNLGVTLTSLPASWQGILLTIKKRGEVSAEELAKELGITASAVRQHMAALVGDGLVGVREIKGLPGRPKHRYLLTNAADGLFPRRYSDLTNDVLQYAADEDPALVERIFDRRKES